jgi:hypothetical protein
MMARKSKEFGELLRQEQGGLTEEKALEKFQNKVKQGPLAQIAAKFVNTAPGQVKMSEVLEDFVEPYLHEAPSFGDKERLFSIAVMAWNIAIMPESEQQPFIDQMIEETLGTTDDRLQKDTRAVLAEMMVRKKTKFADNCRMIAEFQLQDMGQSFHLSVASLPAKATEGQ